MKKTCIIGIVLCLIGIGSLFVSHYISGQVLQGKQQIASAQKKVNTGKKIFSIVPGTQRFGQSITDSAQGQIDEGKMEVAYYENLAQFLKIGGIVVLVIGALSFFLCRSSKKSKS